MAKKVKTIILDESKVKAYFEGIIPYDTTILRDFLKQCTVVNTAIPSEEDFVEYGFMIYKQTNRNPKDYDYALRAKYFQWKEAGWVDGFGTPIKIWKTKLANTIPSLKPMFLQQAKGNTSQNLMENLIKNGLPEFK
jgi:hypothetical protein